MPDIRTGGRFRRLACVVALVLAGCSAPATSPAGPGNPTPGPATASVPASPSGGPTSAQASPGPATPAAITGLRVQGNRIVNAGGQVVRLRGFNNSGTEYACIEGWGIFDAPDHLRMPPSVVAAMATWTGANAVRVPLNEQCWLGLGVSAAYGGDAYRRAIGDYVTLLNSYGFVAVLDLHRSAPGTAASTDQEELPDRDHSVAFWQSVATAFKANGSVVFDLFNEPAPYGEADTARAWRCWRDGGCTLRSRNGGGDYVAAGMNELIGAVRAAGAPNVVLAGGIHWAEMLDQWLAYQPTDPLGNLAASFHDYSFNTRCASLACYRGDLAKVAAKVPLYAGEIGPDLSIGHEEAGTRCPASAVGDTGFARTVFDWLDGAGAGYAAWSFNAWPSCWSLVTDWSGAPTPRWGRLVKARLAAA